MIMPTLKQLSDIEFPIYGITNNHKRIWEEFNVLYIETESGEYVLDNKNISGESLGKRRLKLNNTDNIYSLRKRFDNVASMLKCKYKKFIDNNGYVFEYKKSKYVPLKYFKVTDQIHENDSCKVIISNGQVFKVPCKILYSINWLGLLVTDIGLIPYEFSDTKLPDSRRKI